MTTHRQAALIAAAVMTARYDYDSLEDREREVMVIAEGLTHWLKASSERDKQDKP